MTDAVSPTECNHHTIDILDLSFIDKKYTRLPVCRCLKGELEPWLELREILDED